MVYALYVSTFTCRRHGSACRCACAARPTYWVSTRNLEEYCRNPLSRRSGPRHNVGKEPSGTDIGTPSRRSRHSARPDKSQRCETAHLHRVQQTIHNHQPPVTPTCISIAGRSTVLLRADSPVRLQAGPLWSRPDDSSSADDETRSECLCACFSVRSRKPYTRSGAVSSGGDGGDGSRDRNASQSFPLPVRYKSGQGMHW